MSKSQHYATLHDAVIRYTPAARSEQMEQFLRHIMAAENNAGSLHAKNQNSTATGLFQFTKSTGAAYGLKGQDFYNAYKQCDAVVRFALDNRNVMVGALHREPSAGEYYLAHFASPLKAVRLIQADPSTPISKILDSGAMHANRNIKFHGKKFGEFTAADIQAWANTKMNTNLTEREAYQERHDNHQTTKEEDEREMKERKRLLKEWNMPEGVADNILGQIFIAILKFLMGEAATPAERGEQLETTTPPVNVPIVRADNSKAKTHTPG